MQFLVLGKDGSDSEAPARRLKARGDHLANMSKLKAGGHFIVGGALLDDKDAMAGSAIIVDFPDRAAFDNWLNNDPYVVGNVWQQIEVKPFRAAKID